MRTDLLNDLQVFTFKDKHAQAKGGNYEVSSIYMDNYSLNSYREKLKGDNKRQKIRARFYPPLNNESSIYLELKNKGANKINKTKTPVTPDLIRDIMKGNPCSLDLNNPDPIISHVARLTRVGSFRMHIVINYVRMAMFAKTDQTVRITMDSDMHCDRFQGNIDITPSIPVLPSHTSILEIKTPGYFPDWLRFIIKNMT